MTRSAALNQYCTPLISALAFFLASPGPGAEAAPTPANQRNAQAVEDVRSGKRTDANATWWGFNTEDTTDTIQSALDSGAKKVTIPYMGDPWIVRPLQLRGDQELVLEPGVVLLAKKGEFPGRGDSLMTASGVENLIVRGYGATLRMHKTDYMAPRTPKPNGVWGLLCEAAKTSPSKACASKAAEATESTLMEEEASAGSAKTSRFAT